MSIDYSLYDVYKNNAGIDGMKKLAENKTGYANSQDENTRNTYNLYNKGLRSGYGISEEQDVPLGTLNDYIAMAERNKSSNTLLRNLNENYVPGDNVKKAANKIQNFEYNPETDPVYKSYADMYKRQGESASKSTLNQLNQSSMGRNSSYSSAAAAQVEQAYRQKATEIIPTLAQQAYDKLVQEYSIEKDYDDTKYNRIAQTYQLNRNAQSQDLSDEYTLETLKAQKMNNDVLPEKLRIEVENGTLANEYQRLLNEGATKQNALSQIELEIQQKYGLSTAEAEYTASLLDNDIRKLNKESLSLQNEQLKNGYSAGSSGYSGSSGSSNGTSKEMKKRNADANISHWLYSAALNLDGTGVWKGTSERPQYYAVDKMNDSNVVSNIIDSLIDNGYTYSQALDKVDEYKTNITIETMKIEGKQGWEDDDVVEARKNVLFK